MKHQHSSFVSRSIILIDALLSAAFFSLLMIASQFAFSQAAPAGMVVDVAKPVAEIQPTMWGIFFEDINFGADGGLYAELVKNRSFEFDAPLMGWTEQNKGKFSINRESGSILIMNGLKASNPRFARVTVNADKGYGITNEGFRGMGIKKDLSTTFQFGPASYPATR
jgi:alpha-N-arabinofuranosidase